MFTPNLILNKFAFTGIAVAISLIAGGTAMSTASQAGTRAAKVCKNYNSSFTSNKKRDQCRGELRQRPKGTVVLVKPNPPKEEEPDVLFNINKNGGDNGGNGKQQ